MATEMLKGCGESFKNYEILLFLIFCSSPIFLIIILALFGGIYHG
jgi:hypothetical protein